MVKLSKAVLVFTVLAILLALMTTTSATSRNSGDGIPVFLPQAAMTVTAIPHRTFESWVGSGKINIVDFTAMTGGASSPFRFRLKFNSFESVPSDGYFGPITKGTMTFSYPRQNNPELPYVKTDPYPAPYTHGPAFGETVDYQAREIAPNIFEIHWKETHKGDTVTHVEDFNRQQILTNITNINRVPIPTGFDQFDLDNQLNNKSLFPTGSPVASDQFGFFALVGTMSQSLETDRVWEDQLYTARAATEVFA